MADNPHGPGDRNRQRKPSKPDPCPLFAAKQIAKVAIPFYLGIKIAKLWATRTR